MKKIAALLIFIASAAHAAEAPTDAIQSPTRAVVRFQEACAGELKASLTAADIEKITFHTGVHAGGLRVERMRPERFERPRPGYLPFGEDHRVFGRRAAVTDNKSDTWELTFSGLIGDLTVYVDARTGKVLFIYIVPEG